MTDMKEPCADDGPPSPATGRVLTTSLHRIRRGRAVAFTSDEPEPVSMPKPRPSRAAQMLALAHELQRLIDAGEVRDRAAIAAQVGLTRARVTQVLDLLLLAPDIQERMLEGEPGTSTPAPTERVLRRIACQSKWSEQRRLWNER